MNCLNGEYDHASIAQLEAFQKSFRDAGLTADWRDKRGNSIKQVILGWNASGPKSYLAGRPTNFNRDSEINSSVIKGIELISGTQMTSIPTNPPTDFIDAFFKQGYLFLMDDCNNEVASFPLSVLCKAQNGNKLQFTNFRVQWDNCYVMFPSQGGISQANSLLFTLYLEK